MFLTLMRTSFSKDSHIVFVFIGALILCYLPPATRDAATNQYLVSKEESTVGVVKGIKNCYYLLTTPKFIYLTFTMFANGYIALFVPSQMNRQMRDSISVGIFMSIYACPPPSLPLISRFRDYLQQSRSRDQRQIRRVLRHSPGLSFPGVRSGSDDVQRPRAERASVRSRLRALRRSGQLLPDAGARADAVLLPRSLGHGELVLPLGGQWLVAVRRSSSSCRAPCAR